MIIQLKLAPLMWEKSKETKESPFSAACKLLNQRLGIQGELFASGARIINGLPGSSSTDKSTETIIVGVNPEGLPSPPKRMHKSCTKKVLHVKQVSRRQQSPLKGVK